MIFFSAFSPSKLARKLEIICGHKHRERILPCCEAEHRGMGCCPACLPAPASNHDTCPRIGRQLRHLHGPCASHVTQLVDGGGGNCGVRDAKPSMGAWRNRLLIASCHHVPLLRFPSVSTLMHDDHGPRPTHLFNSWTQEKNKCISKKKRTLNTPLMEPLDTALLSFIHDTIYQARGNSCLTSV